MNGEVQCFSGGHVALGLLAILLLLTALLLIPLLVLVTTDRWRIVSLTVHGANFLRHKISTDKN